MYYIKIVKLYNNDLFSYNQQNILQICKFTSKSYHVIHYIIEIYVLHAMVAPNGRPLSFLLILSFFFLFVCHVIHYKYIKITNTIFLSKNLWPKFQKN